MTTDTNNAVNERAVVMTSFDSSAMLQVTSIFRKSRHASLCNSDYLSPKTVTVSLRKRSNWNNWVELTLPGTAHELLANPPLKPTR